MKTMKKVMYLLLTVALTVGTISCEGPEGPAGANGTNGNANVQTYVYNNPTWWGTTSAMHIDMSGVLTDDVIQNDAVLVYVNHPTSIGDRINVLPGLVWNGFYRNYSIFLHDSSSTTPETIGIISLETDGTFTDNANLWTVNWVKIIIIESSNTTTTTGNGRMANTTPQEAVAQELAAANVDINDYDAVCAYYGINP